MLKRKNILIISPEPWDHIHVSKHCYAKTLVEKGNYVFFLNPPLKNYSIADTKFENLKVLDYPGFWKGLHLMPRLLRKFNQNQVIKRLERLMNCQTDIIWSFDNSVFFDLDLIERPFKISHIVDLNMNFQFERATKSADICFASTRFILGKQQRYNKNAFFINHGFENSAFSEMVLPDMNDDCIKIGYAGNLDIDYMDWDLLNKTIDERSEFKFYFAGSTSKSLDVQSNVYYLGILDKQQLSSFYQQMDILIIVYKADEFPNQLANPHKMMEYLGSGTPIVATYTAEYAHLNCIAMSSKNGDWCELLHKVANDLSNWNSDELCRQRKSYAEQNTYERQIKQIEKYIEKQSGNN